MTVSPEPLLLLVTMIGRVSRRLSFYSLIGRPPPSPPRGSPSPHQHTHSGKHVRGKSPGRIKAESAAELETNSRAPSKDHRLWRSCRPQPLPNLFPLRARCPSATVRPPCAPHGPNVRTSPPPPPQPPRWRRHFCAWARSLCSTRMRRSHPHPPSAAPLLPSWLRAPVVALMAQPGMAARGEAGPDSPALSRSGSRNSCPPLSPHLCPGASAASGAGSAVSGRRVPAAAVA